MSAVELERNQFCIKCIEKFTFSPTFFCLLFILYFHIFIFACPETCINKIKHTVLEQTCRHVCDGACLCQRRPADMFVIPRACVVTDLRTCSWCLVLVSEQTCRHVIVSHPTSSYLLKSTIYCLSRWWEGTCGHVVIIITWLPVLLLCQAAKVQEL